MSVMHTNAVLRDPAPTPVQKFVLLVMALHAGLDGTASMSLRDIAGFCNLSKTRVQDIIDALVKSGHLRIMSTGSGRAKPNTYWITDRGLLKSVQRPEQPPEVDDRPDTTITTKLEWTLPAPFTHLAAAEPTPQQEPDTGPEPGPVEQAPEAPATQFLVTVTQADVSLVLQAAKVGPRHDLPLYWARAEHKAALQEFCQATNTTVADVCAAIREKLGGAGLEPYPKNISEVLGICTSLKGRADDDR